MWQSRQPVRLAPWRLAAIGALAAWLPGCRTDADGGAAPASTAATAGFQEMSDDANLRFRMHFLPGEQGLTFKINLYDHGCGLAVGDIDGDGYDDVYFLNQLGPNALYRNQGDGTFEDVTAAAGPVALDDRVCVGAAFGDYDNDGDQDLYVTSIRGGNALFQNQGGGNFVNTTAAAGLECTAHSQTAAFFDYDRDGYLDLIVTNTAQWTSNDFDEVQKYFPGPVDLFKLAASPKEYNMLYRNNGDGTFTDVTAAANMQGVGWGGDVAIFDYDEDGWLDVFVTNMFGLSRLYRNQGDGTFRDTTLDAFEYTSLGAVGCRTLDFNNDGRLDLFVVDMHSDMWMTAGYPAWKIEERRKYRYMSGPEAETTEHGRALEQEISDLLQLDYRHLVCGNTLFVNAGGGRFKEVSDQAQAETFWPWGVAVGDFDNDGYEDAFLPSGMGYPWFYWRNYLLMNSGQGTFADRSREHGIEPRPRGPYLPEKIGNRPAARSSRCAVVADFDLDGRLDLLVNNFNDVPDYYRNRFPPQPFVGFRLRGTKSNRDAVGAVVKLFVGDEVLIRQVQAAGGYLSQSSKTVHFGLGQRTAIDRVEVRWPSGQVQSLPGPKINAYHDLVEP